MCDIQIYKHNLYIPIKGKANQNKKQSNTPTLSPREEEEGEAA